MPPRLLRLSIGVVTGLLATLAYLGVRGTGPSSAPSVDEDPFLARPLQAPELGLWTHAGDPMHVADFQGRVVALFFGYTQCPDVCPITLAQLSRLQEELDPDGRRLQIVFVSLDPARDTPEVLERFVSRFDSPVIAATAPLDVLRPVALAYGIGFLYRPREGGRADSVAPVAGDYLVDHTARTFILDRAGRLVAQVAPDIGTEVLRNALVSVLDER